MPEPIAPVMMPATSGIICRPATVGLEPCTICRYCGSSRMPPNMPAPRTMLPTLLTAKLRFLNMPQRQQRVVLVGPLGEDEGDQPDDADGVAEQRPAGVPAPDAALLGDDQQRHQADDQRQRAGPVDAVVAAGVRQVQHAHDDDERERCPAAR